MHVDHSLQRRNDYMAKHFGPMKSNSIKPDGDAAAARFKGYLAGQATEIRSGIRTAEDRAALINPPLALSPSIP